MRSLHVLYDAECELCRRLRVWLARQPQFVPLRFIPLQTLDLASRFPGVENMRPGEQLLVISDAGDVWRGGHAWVTVLWALRDYREWAQRLAHPALLPFARRVCVLVSENRHALSRWFARSDGRELRAQLATASNPGCSRGRTCAIR